MTALRTRAAPLWLALLFSVLAHALTLSGGWLKLPQSEAERVPLTARLLPLSPVATPAVKPTPTQSSSPPRAPRIATAPATPRSDAPAPWTPPAPQAAADTESAPEMPDLAETPAPAFEPVVVANAAPGSFAPEPVPIRSLPRRGRIAYNLNYFLSNTPALVGHTVLTWEAADTRYQLLSLSEPVGLARLTRFGPREYRSSGTVTERGLQPQDFTSNVMLRGKTDASAARFDWSSGALQFGRSDDQKNAALPAGSQDLLSFMYQLSLAPPPRGRLQMPITNGTRFETYDIEVLDEETIDTPLGKLRALPVKQIRRDGRESIEVWLAAEYRYLPVRIRVINRDGTLGGEQIATEISVGEK